ncbi:MAG TPA: hypothetical protein VGJ73_17685 [Verrucomicrobiae bacterium]
MKILILLLAVGTLALYWPVRHFDFLFYDDPYFVDNPGVLAGLSWQTFKWAMTDIVFNDWHPVTLLSFLLTHQLFGVNQGAEHLVNVEFHAANAVLLFLLLLRLTGATWRSVMVAAIFAWHPLRVESVCWVAERRDVLFAFFMLLSLLCYAEFAQRQKEGKSRAREVSKPDRRWWNLPYFFALVFFILSFLNKGMVATLPFLLLLLDFWPLERFRQVGVRRLVLEKIPFFALTFFFSGLTVWVHKKHGDYRSLHQFGMTERLQDAILSYYKYLAQLFWPSHLALIYPYPASYDVIQISLIVLLLIAVSLLCMLELSRRPYLAVSWFWYLGTTLPVTGLVQFGSSPMGDRFTYIPLIGIVISLVWLVCEWVSKGGVRRALAISSGIVILVILMLLSRVQILYWQNTVTLFQHTVDVTADNTCAQYPLAMGLEHEGRLRQAAVHYRISLALEPDLYHDFDYEHLAEVLVELRQYHEAVKDFDAALKPDPDWIDAEKNLAWLLATCPDPGVRDGPRAIQLARRACEATHYRKGDIVATLAAAYAEAGQFDEAVVTVKKAIKLAQDYDETSLAQQSQRLLKMYLAHKAYYEQPNDKL